MSSIGRFRTDQRGTTAIVFSLCLLPILAVVGAAIDHGRAVAARSDLQRALDGTVLLLATDPRPRTDAQLLSLAEPMVKTTLGSRDVVAPPSVTVSQSPKTLTVTASLQVKASLTSLIGTQTIEVGATASAAKQAATKLRLRVLVDTSASMGLAADEAGRDKLRALTGCAFACHDPEGGQKKSNLQVAIENRIETRVDVLRTAIEALVAKLGKDRGVNDEVSISVNAFDDTITSPVPLTTMLANVTAYTGAIKLGYNTSFSNAMPAFDALFDKQGDGHAAPLEYALIVTDGVQGRRDRAGGFKPFDASLCAHLKSSAMGGVKVIVLNTTYVPMPMEQPYRETVMPIQDKLAPALKACASPGLYFEGTNKDEILKQFDAILGVLKQIRITA